MAALAQVVPIDKNKSLFEIHDHLEALYDSIDMIEDPELKRQAEAEIDSFIVLEVKKVDRITSYISHLESQQAAAAAEVKRLQDRKRSLERAQERIERSVERVMTTWGMTKLEGRLSSLSLKKCPPSVEVLDQKLVPQEYLRTTVTESVDKTAAKVDLAAGREIPGLKLVTGKHTVVRR